MKEIADLFRAHESFLILTHVDPDGDALGSALGLAHVLREAGKRVEVRLPSPVPRLYAFLPGADDIVVGAPPERIPADVLVVVDANSPNRLGSFETLAESGSVVVDIDHHPDNTRFGTLQLVDPTAAAAALLVYELAIDEGFAISPSAAECLYVGVITDTGRFTFTNTDARAIGAAAALARIGADPARVAEHVFGKQSVASTRLLGRVLDTLDLREDGRVAAMHVTHAMLEETGACQEDTEGFVTYARTLEGVRVAVFLRETDAGDVKVSFRSNGGVPIDGVAGKFGGGGHPSASGARVPGPIEKAKESILRAVSEHLESLV